MGVTGYCSLVIRGHGLQFMEIESHLQMQATKKYYAGKRISKVIEKNPWDVICFEKNFDNEKECSQMLEELTSDVYVAKEYLEVLKEQHEVIFKCFVQSEHAQISWKFSPNAMARIAELKLDLEFSILSWGKVEAGE